ncbi:AEC family transporter [Hwanghaeella grinnelliae]|uniref:AEC family transporter n=1 Tax=Hwanghaeella grinnelliae TaxID=2500179 RepID=A0A3S2WT91_9PROT|nr:AEC family transporter [Hwanghaeella grinnelliae]RVU37957.1 AEC family transporter [Hwanghaeella grinnelliae]
MTALLAPILSAIFPIFAVVVLGSALRRSGFLAQTFWDGLDKAIFWVLFPCLLFSVTGQADLSGPDTANMAIVLVASTLATALLAWLCKPLIGLPERSFVAVYQSAFRMNAYVGLAASASLLGASGYAFAAIAVAIVAPLINTLGVIALAGMNGRASGTRPSILSLARSVIANPLILSTLAGAIINLADLPFPDALWDTTGVIGKAALPMALLSVGAGLRLRALKSAGWPVAIGAFLKLIAAPAITVAAALALGFSGPAALVAVIFTAPPASVSSYQMTKAMGGDADLMAASITVQTVAAALTMTLVLLYATSLFLPNGL